MDATIESKPTVLHGTTRGISETFERLDELLLTLASC
jgi:hypothetical protein